MKHKPSKYILNTRTNMIHKRRGLTEQCNTDQIKHKQSVNQIEIYHVMCRHCFR
jgi:hypothetical protein